MLMAPERDTLVHLTTALVESEIFQQLFYGLS